LYLSSNYIGTVISTMLRSAGNVACMAESIRTLRVLDGIPKETPLVRPRHWWIKTNYILKRMGGRGLSPLGAE